jgi:hypothetical protein
MKKTEENDEFTQQGSILGLVFYIIVIMIVAWVFI